MNKLPFTPADIRLVSTKTFVRAIRVEAQIGLHPYEYGRTQPLDIEIEVEAAPSSFEHAGDIINYEHFVHWTREVAASGHIELVETFAHRLALACLRDPRVLAVRVRVEKPEALAPAVAGIELVLRRGEAI